jgi:hypothetical protein
MSFELAMPMRDFVPAMRNSKKKDKNGGVKVFLDLTIFSLIAGMVSTTCL